ncbi:hypothetical protein SGRIM128S_09430 [Streptomyces griseomycini]
MVPSLTKIASGSTRVDGQRRASAAVCCQCVVARLPSSSPAAPRTKAPVHTEATRPALSASAFAAVLRPGSTGAPGRASPPTTTSVS